LSKAAVVLAVLVYYVGY